MIQAILSVLRTHALRLPVGAMLGGVLNVVTAVAGDSNFITKVWGVDEGLPSASVTSIAQTPEGYLWAGSLYRGLLRFDGTRFVAYNQAHIPEIQGQAIRRLMVDQPGRLWISTYANTLVTWDHDGFSLARQKGNPPERLLWSDASRVTFLGSEQKLLCGRLETNQWQWQTYELPRGMDPPQICADGEGNIWCAKSETEIALWRDGRVVALSPPPGLENQRLRVLATDQLGRVWAGTDQSLSLWQAGRFVKMNPPNEEEPLAVTQIIPDGTNGAWVVANQRLRRLCAGRWLAECDQWKSELAKVGVSYSLQRDGSGGLWGGGSSQGLVHVLSDGSFCRMTAHEGLPGGSVVTMLVDCENNLWMGYKQGGLVKVRPALFQAIGRQQGLTEPLVSTVSETSSATVWVGTDSGLVFHYEHGQCKNLALPELEHSGSSQVAVDTGDRIWISNSRNGLMVFDAGRVRAVASPGQLGELVRLMLPAHDGRLWVATLDNLWAVKSNKLTQLRLYRTNPPQDTQKARLAALAESADGTLWVGTYGGVLLRSANGGIDFERIDPPDRPSLGRLWALCSAADGSLWIGTSDGGLLRYREGKFSRYTTHDGLPSDCITQVLMDDRENLWLGTDVGIARVDRTSLTRFDDGQATHLSVSIFGRSEGLLTIGTAVGFQPNCWRGRDGLLSFAMVNGVAQVNPKNFAPNVLPPGVALEEIRGNGQPVWPRRRGAVLTDTGTSSLSAKPTSLLRLGPGRQDLEFFFTALSLSSPQGVRLRYQLEGVDTGWSDIQTERHASYRALGPGKYHFRVCACNSDGLWNVNGVNFGLIILPYFWQTLWFHLAVALGLALLTATSVALPLRFRHRRRLAQLKQKNVLEQERARVARDLHDDLGAGLTHIGLIGGLASRPSTSPERSRQLLEEITSRSRELVVGLDEIVWAINPKHDTTTSIGAYFCNYAQDFLRPTEIACRLDVATTLPVRTLDFGQRHHLFLAFKEALTNIVRHAQATEVWIRIRIEDDQLSITVEDNGRGISAPPVAATADGLDNMSARLKQIGGRCEIHKPPAGGTTVFYILPLTAGQPRKPKL